MLYSAAGSVVLRGGAFQDDPHRLELSAPALADGTYNVRVLARAFQDGVTIAVPIEGTFENSQKEA